MVIRMEEPRDYFNVESMIKRAFWNVNAPGCDEHYLTHCLRRHPDYLPGLSRVLERDGQIIAAVFYARACLVDDSGYEKDILTFGPLAVEPSFQRQGYGKALLAHTFEAAKAQGYDAIVIFGHPGNYVSRGFVSCRRKNISLKNGAFPTAMLVKELVPGALDSRHWYYRESAAYDVDPAGYDAFDQAFEQYVPKTEPRQEEFYIYSHSALNA